MSKRGGKLRAGIPLEQNRTYPKELVARIKRRYLTHHVLGYHGKRGRGRIMETLGREFGFEPSVITTMLQYEGVF